MELNILAIIMLIMQPAFVYLYINSVVRPSIFIASTVAMSVFYADNFLHAAFVLGGINLVGVLLVKLAERKGYTRFSTSYFFSGVICWFVIFGVLSFFISYLSLPSMQSVANSFYGLLAFPAPTWWPVIAFFGSSILVLAVSATILLSDANRSIAFKLIIVFTTISPVLPLFSNYFWISQAITFLVVVQVLGACQKYFFKGEIGNDNVIAFGFAGALLSSIVIYLIRGLFNLY